MTKTLKRIAPLQLGKMLGALYGIMGLIFLPFIFVFSALGGLAAKSHSTGISSQAAGAALGAGLGIGMALVMVIAYAVMGFIGGIIAASVYNLIAKFIGGIQVEVE